MARKLKKPKRGLKVERANKSGASWNIGCLNMASAVCAEVRQHDLNDLI